MLLRIILFNVFCFFTLICQGEENTNDPRQTDSQQVWENKIRPVFFSDKHIYSEELNNIVSLKAPYRTEDAAIVPISIQTDTTIQNAINKIYVFIDKNPSPLVGIFKFNRTDTRADIAMRVRVDDFSYIRTVVETVNGKLYMDKSFVKASGGCSAPAGPGEVKQLGKIKTRLVGKFKLMEQNLIQLMIKHPNFSGLESVTPGKKKPEPHFIKSLTVNFNEQQILHADLTFSISTNPSFRFYILPENEGVLDIVATDTKNNVFTHKHVVDKNSVSYN